MGGELFANEVMPEFAGRHHEQEEWKRQVLAGEIELDELDTSPDVLPRPERRAIETTASTSPAASVYVTLYFGHC